MATITLTGLYVHDAADLSDFVWLRHLYDPVMTAAKEGEVVELSGGRLVYRGRPTVRRTYSGRVRVHSRADREQLASWVGRPVMIRDGVGHLLYGVFHQAPFAELKGIDQRDWSVTVESLTMTPAA